MLNAFLLGFSMITGIAACALVIFGLFTAFEYTRNFILRYQQSAWYPDEVEQRFWPRARWAFGMLRTLL